MTQPPPAAAQRYVLFYPASSAPAELVGEHLGAHFAHFGSFKATGDLLAFGPFQDRERFGSMGIFTSADSARRFVTTDPFVIHGVVTEYEIREWQDVLG